MLRMMHSRRETMILKKLFEDFDLSIERILIKEYKRLKLTMQEMSVLLALFSIYKKRKNFSTASIAKRVELSTEEIGKAVESLMDKGFLTIELESKDGKQREIFNLDQTFKKIESLFIQDDLDETRAAQQSDIADTITLIEQGLGRGLLPYELENIRRWYDDKAFTHDQIINACKQASERMSIKYVERILNQIIPEKILIDQDVDQALDELFKSMK